MACPCVLPLPFLLIISMTSVALCSLLDDIVDPNIIPDITGMVQVTVSGGVVGCIFPARQRSEPSLPAGLNVALTCDGGRTVITDAVTNTNGFFKITINTLQNSLLHPRQCDDCRIVTRGVYTTCGLFAGRRGALLAPIDCRDAVVEKLHGDEQERNNVVQYKTKPFYFDPSY